MKALIIDDSRAMRSIIAGIVAHLGYQTEPASDGIDALNILEQDPTFDLLLVDWNMPNMNGLEFVKRARADERLAHCKIVMITTETEMDRVMNALDAGADEYVMKPFTREALQEKLTSIDLTEQSL